MTKEKLLAECLKVRKALENAAKCNMVPDQMFCLFPHGACLTSTIVLAQYLFRFDDKKEFLIVRGWNQNTSHAWLEYNGYAIDVTADQFPEIDEPVYITADRKFHSQFQYERKTAKLSEYTLTYDERVLYNFVCENVEQKILNV
jgi:hypothetical protein